VQSLQLHAAEIPKDSIIVAPHGDQFLITATLGLSSRQTPPNDPDSGDTYWLLSRVENGALLDRSIVLFTNANSATVLIKSRALEASLPAMDSVERFSLYRRTRTWPQQSTAETGWREPGTSNPQGWFIRGNFFIGARSAY